MAGNRLICIVILILSMTLTTNAHAAFSSEFASCMSNGLAAKGSDPAMADCYRDEIKRQEVLLEQMFQAKMQVLANEEQRDSLNRSQKQWKSNYIETCKDRWADEEGGTLWWVLFYGCVAADLDERIDWLRKYPDIAEPDRAMEPYPYSMLCDPLMLSSGQVLSITLPEPHGQDMIAITPDRRYLYLSYESDPPPGVDGPPIKGRDSAKMTKLSLNKDSIGFDDSIRHRTPIFDRPGDYEFIIGEWLDGDEAPWQGYCRVRYSG